MTQPQEVQQNIQENQITNRTNAQENQQKTVSPIITEQEQERMLNNLEEYEKILNHLKEQRKKEKEMNIRKRIEEKELEIQNLEDQIKKEKDERNTLFKELEELIGIKIIIAPENSKQQQEKPNEINTDDLEKQHQNNLYPENGNHSEWGEFKNGSQQNYYSKWEEIPRIHRTENNLEKRIQWKNQQGQQNNGFERKRNTCSNCGIEGHYLQDCPMIECKICNKKGHIMKFCSERICKICNRKGHIEINCEQYDPNYANRRRIQNDIGEEFLFGKRFERNGY